MRERWKKVPGWPYEASSSGAVRRAGDEVPLTPEIDKDDYERYTLTDGKRRKRLGGHQIVALAWHGPPEVRHRNGDRRDNRPENLLYGSRRDNERDKRSLRSIQSVRTGSTRGNGNGNEGIDGRNRDVSCPGKPVTGVTEGA